MLVQKSTNNILFVCIFLFMLSIFAAGLRALNMFLLVAHTLLLIKSSYMSYCAVQCSFIVVGRAVIYIC